jgi:hypothetical protein
MDGRGTAPHELLLVRVGHHLWREYKSRKPSGWPAVALYAALESVWDAKEAVRVELRQEWREFYENRSKRLKETGFGA